MNLTTPSNTLNTFTQGSGIIRPVAHDLFENDDASGCEEIAGVMVSAYMEDDKKEASEIIG